MDQSLISVLKMSDDRAGERFMIKVSDAAQWPLQPETSRTVINNLTEARVRLELAQRGQPPVFADRCLRQARAAYDPRQD